MIEKKMISFLFVSKFCEDHIALFSSEYIIDETFVCFCFSDFIKMARKKKPKNKSGCQEMRRRAYLLSKNPDVRQYFLNIVERGDCDENILHPRVAFESIETRLKEFEEEGDSDFVMIKREDYTNFLVEVEKKRQSQPPLPPSVIFKTREGWMAEPKNPELWYFKKRQTRGAVKILFTHLSSNLDVKKLPILCKGDCNCVVQKSPVGDRGGCPRRVPCGRVELRNAPWMEPTIIKHVRNISLYRLSHRFRFRVKIEI
jgi:hypothetical protein